MMVTRPVLRYHGGKWRLAPWIISHFPAHRVYVEPFGGGASVLMRKPRSYAEVYNDAWGIVVNVFRVLRDPTLAAELERLLRLTPFARDEFDQCGDAQIRDIVDPVERARRTILRSFAGFGSAASNPKHATGFRANSNRRGTTPAHDWANLPDCVAAWTDRLRGVVIENRDAIAVMAYYDSADTLHYVDPPYPRDVRNLKRGNAYYAHELSDGDEDDGAKHAELLTFLRGLRGMVVLSGYRCAMYDEMLSGWRRVDKATHADGARDRVESLWLSPNIQPRSVSMFETTT